MTLCEHCQQPHEADQRFCPNTGKMLIEKMLPLGSVLEGKYRLEHVLGAGGMGTVFAATHLMLNKRMAIKVLQPELSGNAQASARLLQEAQAASATGHRNIAQVTDIGHTEQGWIFMVMEFLEGATLADLVQSRGGRLEVTQAVELISQLLSGLEAVHRKGIVHRDLKPENMMVVQDDDGAEVVKILDFGISKRMGDNRSILTTPGMLMGTPQFMAPEQIDGAQTVDRRADLYATGAILYLLLAGEPPHTGSNLAELLARIVAGQPVPLSQRAPNVPTDVERVVMQALEKKPEDRFHEAAAFRRALQGALHSTAVPHAALQKGQGPLKPAQGLVAAPLSSQSPSEAGYANHLTGSSLAVGDLLKLDELVTLDEFQSPSASTKSPSRAATPAPTHSPTQNPAAVPTPAAPVAAKPAAAPIPVNDDARFMPDPTSEEKLELAKDRPKPRGVTAARPAISNEASATTTASHPSINATGVYRGVARRDGISSHVRTLVAVAAVVVGAVVIWWAWDHLFRASNTSGPMTAAKPQSVLVFVETDPREAEVYVDGVFQVTQPIRLPYAATPFTVEVRSTGFMSQSVTITPNRDHSIRIKLKPVKKRK